MHRESEWEHLVSDTTSPGWELRWFLNKKKPHDMESCGRIDLPSHLTQQGTRRNDATSKATSAIVLLNCSIPCASQCGSSPAQALRRYLGEFKPACQTWATQVRVTVIGAKKSATFLVNTRVILFSYVHLCCHWFDIFTFLAIPLAQYLLQGTT